MLIHWRHNLRDERGNRMFELAVAASDAPLVVCNVKDLANPQLKFPAIRILTPAQWLDLGRSG